MQLTFDFAERLAIALAVLVVFIAIAWATNAFLDKLSARDAPDRRQVYRLLGSTGRAVFVILGLVSALGTVGVDVSALVAGLGLTGFALGFALKDALSNLLAGSLIIIYRPFRVGDRVKVSGCEGTVDEINLRYVRLAADAAVHLVPSATCLSQVLTVTRAATSGPGNGER